MNQPVVTACNCTGEPRSILDEAGQPMLVEGVMVCPHCLRSPFASDVSDSEGGEI